MKRYARVLLVLTGLLAVGTVARADGWHSLHYGGYQPWWNIFAHRTQMSCEEERLQRFWHDYYDSLKRYYGSLDRIDWVAYYKNHGYQINAGCGGPGGCGGQNRIQFAPVFVSPTMQWAVPNSGLSGAPTGAPCPPIGAFGGPTMGGPSMGMAPGMGMGPQMGMAPGMAPGPQMGMAYPH